jgi:hypothetical protein
MPVAVRGDAAFQDAPFVPAVNAYPQDVMNVLVAEHEQRSVASFTLRFDQRMTRTESSRRS